MVLSHDGHLGDTIIAGNTYIRRNIIMESRDLVLSYIHIDLHTGDANIGSNQAKQKRSQISHFAKLLKVLILIKFWRLLDSQ